MAHKYIQPQIFSTNLPKDQAISAVENYINSDGHLSEFKSGEIVSIEYKREGVRCTTTALVNISANVATLFAQISEKDTIKIVEKDGNEAPEDKNSLWLSDNWDAEVGETYEASDLKSTVKELTYIIGQMREELDLCKEALNNTLGGGDILLNSTKYFLENEYEPERPEDAENPYTTGDTEIYTWDVYIGPSPLTEYADGGIYSSQRYYPKVRAFNSAGEEIEITSAMTVTMSCGGGSAEVILTGNTLYAVTSGDSNFYATLTDPEHSFSESKTYLLKFEKNEEPSYQQYNVKHLLVKHAESYDYMLQHASYLLVGEFCWCIKEQALYLKEKAKNGTIQLFKVNGQGGVTPTGETEEITYAVTDDGTFNADATEGSVHVDDEGILNLIGYVDDEGILILTNTEIEPEPGPTPTPTGETSSVSAEVDRDGTLVIESEDGSAEVDREGNLILTAQVNANGDIIINDI